MKKTTILCVLLSSGFLMAETSAQESRSDLLKAQEDLLNQIISVEKKKIEGGVKDFVSLLKAQMELQKVLIKQAKTLEEKIKGQKELIALAEKGTDEILGKYKIGVSSYLPVLEHKLEILKAKMDLLDMEGDAALDEGRKALLAEIEKDEKMMENFQKRKMGGGVIGVDEVFAEKAKFVELRVESARTKADKIKYQKEMIDLLDKLQSVLTDRYKTGSSDYSHVMDAKLALIKAKLKLLDLEESV